MTLIQELSGRIGPAIKIGLVALCAGVVLPVQGASPVRVLILSGHNNHNWKATTPVLQQILIKAGGFAVEVTEHPEQCTAETFSKYDVILSNWNSFGRTDTVDIWPVATREAFLDFVRGGKGVVFVHAGSSSFYKWPEYQALGGAWWGNGKTSHNAPHAFLVTPVGDHPVIKGVKPFMTTDELWLNPAVDSNAVVIATADKQPSALVTTLGKGRGFTLLLGHDAKCMENAGFQTLLLRGLEWAATRKR